MAFAVHQRAGSLWCDDARTSVIRKSASVRSSDLIAHQGDFAMNSTIASVAPRALAVAGALILSLPALAITPPEPFQLATDGVTRQSMEAAGILRPNGRSWATVMGKALFW